MKKIVGAAAALLLSAAAFAEVGIGVNARFRPALVYYKDTLSTSSSTGIKELAILDFADYSSSSDELSFSATGRNAGIKFVTAYTNNFSYSYWETPDGTAYKPKGPGIETYYGWLELGRLKLSGGNFGSTLLIPKYNFTMLQAGLTDSDTANWGVGTFSYLRQVDTLENRAVSGTSYTLTSNRVTFLYGHNDITSMEGKRQVSMQAEYTVPRVAGGDLILRGSAFANNWGSTDSYVVSYNNANGRYVFVEDPSADDERVGAGFGAEAAYKSNAFVLDLVFKMPVKDAFGIGAYIDIKSIPNLTLATGFTWGKQNEIYTDNDSGKYTLNSAKLNAGFTAWAADLRLFYKFSRTFLLGTQCKFSWLKEEELSSASARYLDSANSTDAELAFESVVTAQYTVNSVIGLQLDAGFYLRDLDDNDGYDAAENFVTLRPGVQFTAGPRAKVSVAGFVTAALGADENDTKKVAFRNTPVNLLVQVPVVFRVTM